MEKACKGILIDPFACTVSEIDIPQGEYSRLYPILSHESMPVSCFTAAYPPGLDGRDAVFVDDDGLLKPCDRFFVWDGYQPMAGKGLVLGANDRGNTVSPRTPLTLVRGAVRFLERRSSAGLRPIHTAWVKPE